MARLACRFIFLRRSFYRDLSGMNLDEAFRIMQAKNNRYRGRSAKENAQVTAEAASAILNLEGACRSGCSERKIRAGHRRRGDLPVAT